MKLPNIAPLCLTPPECPLLVAGSGTQASGGVTFDNGEFNVINEPNQVEGRELA
jgi:hypothetical protein